MNASTTTLYLSETTSIPSPTPADLALILKHLNEEPEAFFLLEFEGGYLQGYEEPGQESTCYHLELADQDEETGDLRHWQNQSPVPLKTFAEILALVFANDETWRTKLTWKVLDLSLAPDAEVGLGQFSPNDATRLLNALDQAEIPVRMEQVSGTSFGLIITAEHLEAANAVLAKVFNLQV